MLTNNSLLYPTQNNIVIVVTINYASFRIKHHSNLNSMRNSPNIYVLFAIKTNKSILKTLPKGLN